MWDYMRYLPLVCVLPTVDDPQLSSLCGEAARCTDRESEHRTPKQDWQKDVF